MEKIVGGSMIEDPSIYETILTYITIAIVFGFWMLLRL